MLDEGTITTTKNERCCRKPDVGDVESLVLISNYICRQICFIHIHYSLLQILYDKKMTE